MTAEDEGLTPYQRWSLHQFGAEWQEVMTPIKTLPFNVPNAESIKALLRQRRCQIEDHLEYSMLTFPAGTRKKLTGPVTIVERYTVQLPDGYTLRQEVDRVRGISLLFLPEE
jgi:hypothetical protein